MGIWENYATFLFVNLILQFAWITQVFTWILLWGSLFFLTNKKSLFFFTNKIVFFWLTKKILQEKNVGNQIQILYILQLTFNQQYVTSIVLMMLAMGTVLRLLRWKMLPSLKGLKVGSAHLVKTPTSLWSGQQQCLTEAEAVQWQ